MGIFNRAGRMIRARANNAVDKMERPDLMIQEAVRDAERDRNSVYAALHKGMQGAIMTRKQAEEQERKGALLRDRAGAQMNQGKDALAEQSMRSALVHEYTAESLRQAVVEMEIQNSGLTEALSQLDAALEVIKAMAVVEEARYRQAIGSQAAAEARYGGPNGKTSAFEELDRARKKAMGVAASAEATLIIGSGRMQTSQAALPDFAYEARAELGLVTPHTELPSAAAAGALESGDATLGGLAVDGGVAAPEGAPIVVPPVADKPS